MASESPESVDQLMGEQPPRFVPGIPVWIALALFAAIGVGAWLQADVLAEKIPMAGQAMSRIIIAGMTVLSVCTLAGWLVIRSSHAVGLKIGVIAAILALPIFVRVEHSGDLFSFRFHLRWYEPDRALSLPEVPSVALETKVGQSQRADILAFNQYLGPNRNGVITSFSIAPMWEPEVQWRKTLGAGWSGFVVNNSIAFTQEQRGDDELVVAYDIGTGDPIWFHAQAGQRHDDELGGIGPRATPTLHRGRVFAMGATGILLCLDEGTGELIWKRNVITDVGSDLATDLGLVMWGRAGSPLIVDDMVVVPGGGKDEKFVSLMGYSVTTGEPVWKAGTDQISYSSPMLYTLAGVRQIVITNEASVSGYDVETGAELWSHPRPGKSSGDANTSQPQLVGTDRLLITKGYGGGAELIQLAKSAAGEWTVTSLWANKRALNTKLTNAYVLGDYAYGLNNGVLECVDLANGESKWRQGRMGHGQVIVVGEYLLVLSEDGELFRVKASPDGYEATEAFDILDAICWNTLCVYGDLVLARNNHEAVGVRIFTAPPEGSLGPAADGRMFGTTSATATLPMGANPNMFGGVPIGEPVPGNEDEEASEAENGEAASGGAESGEPASSEVENGGAENDDAENGSEANDSGN